MEEKEAVNADPVGIPEAVRELLKSLTTSEKLRVVTPEMEKVYKLQKENARMHQESMGHLQDLRKEISEIRQMQAAKQRIDPWKFIINVCNFIVGEITKRS